MSEDKDEKEKEKEKWRKQALDTAWNKWILSGRSCDLFYALSLMSPEKKQTSGI